MRLCALYNLRGPRYAAAPARPGLRRSSVLVRDVRLWAAEERVADPPAQRLALARLLLDGLRAGHLGLLLRTIRMLHRAVSNHVRRTVAPLVRTNSFISAAAPR